MNPYIGHDSQLYGIEEHRFLTTCGLQAVGSPCTDEGEELPLHGSIANYPCEQAYWLEEKVSPN